MSIKQLILSNAYKCKFPQSLFSTNLKKLINKRKGLKILDVPCGSGEISYALAHNENNFVEGYDLSKQHIVKAKKIYSKSNLRFGCKNIFGVLNKNEKFDIICIINSLFLLPKTNTLLEKVYKVLNNQGNFYLIVPNIKSKNFRIFQKDNPDTNLFVKGKDELINQVRNKGFEFEKAIGIGNTHIYGRKELKYMFFFGNIYLHFLNVISIKKAEPSYYLLAFRKKTL
jgi:2-polyprenyl-3-methyl-5-hydroxy-6-metoxy-1,4-benzoquinol methylase